MAVARLTALARRLHVDVVHSNSLHSWYGWAAARLAAVARTWCTRARSSCSRGAALRVERALCRHFATRVIAVSYAVAAQLDPANVVVLDEYLDADEFLTVRAGAFRARVAIPDDEPLVGAVARLDPLKGLDVLLDAYAIAQRGSVPICSSWSSGVRCSVRTRTPPTCAPAWPPRRARCSSSRATTSPTSWPTSTCSRSRRWSRSRTGLVLVEALASGTPVVATDHGGPPEIVARATPGTAHGRAPGRRRRARHRAARPAAAADVAGAPSGPPARASHRRPPRFAELFRDRRSRADQAAHR